MIMNDQKWDYRFVSLLVSGFLKKTQIAASDKVLDEFQRMGSMGFEFAGQIRVESTSGDGRYWIYAVFKAPK